MRVMIRAVNSFGKLRFSACPSGVIDFSFELMASIDPGKLEKHLRYLTEDIGVRLAGMPGERAAADYRLTHHFAPSGQCRF